MKCLNIVDSFNIIPYLKCQNVVSKLYSFSVIILWGGIEMTLINPEIFREYDIRGIAETDLSSETVYSLGRALAKYFIELGATKVLIGRDNRLSSKRIRNDLIAGLTNAGCWVIDIGTVITPLFYYARILYEINAGVDSDSKNPG